MRRHRHMVSVVESHSTGRTSRAVRWHSVRVHHEDVWDWCAHHEEVIRHLQARRLLRPRSEMGLQPAQ